MLYCITKCLNDDKMFSRFHSQDFCSCLIMQRLEFSTPECELWLWLHQKREAGFNLFWRHFLSQFMIPLAALLPYLPKFIKLKLSLRAFEKFTEMFKFGKLKSELEGKDFYTTEAFRNRRFSVLLEWWTKFFQVEVEYIFFTLASNTLIDKLIKYGVDDESEMCVEKWLKSWEVKCMKGGEMQEAA